MDFNNVKIQVHLYLNFDVNVFDKTFFQAHVMKNVNCAINKRKLDSERLQRYSPVADGVKKKTPQKTKKTTEH